MPKAIPLHPGQRFGDWTVIRYVKLDKPHRYYLCACSCGARRTVAATILVNGKSSDCGHRRNAQLTQRNHKHGLAPRNKPLSKEYIAWINMKVRCYNPNAQKHHYYGGKGITVCKRWRNSFANFIADMGPCPKGFTLDRINGNDSYRPGNCRWASWTQQQRNRGNNKLSVTKAALIRASAGTHRELAARFGCSTALIGFVKTGKYWKV